MKRNNISDVSLSMIKKSYKLVYSRGLKLEAAIKKVKELNNDIDDPCVNIFISSIQESERGILR